MIQEASWQSAVAAGFISIAVYLGLVGVSLLFSFLGVYPWVSGVLLMASLGLLVATGALWLNLSRDTFSWLIFGLLFHFALTVLSFGLHYRATGIVDVTTGGTVSDFPDCLYFSATTWTTLGLGEFKPLAEMRLFTAWESFTGALSLAIFASVLFLWFTENLISKESAFFDGNRRHKGSLGRTRMRVKTWKGEERDIGDEWRKVATPGCRYRYDDLSQEWIEFDETSESESAIDGEEENPDEEKKS